VLKSKETNECVLEETAAVVRAASWRMILPREGNVVVCKGQTVKQRSRNLS
jgi:hypothetical protein